MGRGKIEIKKIENANSRQVTFSKRRGGLFKKANELAILCDAEVGVIVFSSTGKSFEFSSCSMKKILSRYTKRSGSVNAPSREINVETEDSAEVDALKEELEKLKSKNMQLLGKDLKGLNLSELHALEQQLNEGFTYIKEKKELLLMQEMAQSKMLEKRAVHETGTLRTQVEEVRKIFPLANEPIPLSGSMEKDSGILKQASDEDSNTALYLGLSPSTGVSRKVKRMDDENHSRKCGTQMNLSL